MFNRVEEDLIDQSCFNLDETMINYLSIYGICILVMFQTYSVTSSSLNAIIKFKKNIDNNLNFFYPFNLKHAVEHRSYAGKF